VQPQEAENLTFTFSQLDPDQRLTEMILYVSDKCSTDPTFGATKLNKILFFADFHAYHRRGHSITGSEYMRLGRGPAPRRLRPIRDQMIENKVLAIHRRKVFDLEQHRTVPLREPDLTSFSADDIAVVDEVIEILWGKTAEEVSEMSHGIAWRAARDEQSIPYQAAYLSNEPLTHDDCDRARELANEYGLC
jgi:hypothetical protein